MTLSASDIVQGLTMHRLVVCDEINVFTLVTCSCACGHATVNPVTQADSVRR